MGDLGLKGFTKRRLLVRVSPHPLDAGRLVCLQLPLPHPASGLPHHGPSSAGAWVHVPRPAV